MSMKLILVDVLNEITREYISTEIWPLVSKSRQDFQELRSRGLHIPTLIDNGVAEYFDHKEPYVLKVARLSREGSYIAYGVIGHV